METFHNGLIAIVSVTVVLGIMIFVHEWGHFIAAKLSGVRVDVFSFGFGPRLFGVKRGDTDYRLSALPLGGYVRMAGDNPVEERSGAAYEFLSKPRWVRVVIAVAGPAMNVLLAFVIFWGIYWLVGVPYDTDLRKPALVVALPQFSAFHPEVQPGDLIMEVNGVKTATWDDVFAQIAQAKPGDTVKLVVSRNGAQTVLSETVPAKAAPWDLVGYPQLPAVLDEPAIGMPAEKAGMKAGDTVVAINGKPVVTWDQLFEIVRNSNGATVHFVLSRDGREFPVDVTPVQQLAPDGQVAWQIGVTERTHESYERHGVATAARDAGAETLLYMRQIVDVIAGLFTGKVSIRELQGVVGIARVSGQAAKHGPMSLLGLMAVISLNLGLLNLLPIPILDGGHVLLLAIEGTLRRDLSVAVKERFVQVGLVFLLGIFAFVMYSDILKLVQSRH
jgi:regulator of sigma E protease